MISDYGHHHKMMGSCGMSTSLRRQLTIQCQGNYSATLNNMMLVHWPLMGGLLHLVQRGGAWVGRAAVPITILLYNGPLLCGFNVASSSLSDRTST